MPFSDESCEIMQLPTYPGFLDMLPCSWFPMRVCVHVTFDSAIGVPIWNPWQPLEHVLCFYPALLPTPLPTAGAITSFFTLGTTFIVGMNHILWIVSAPTLPSSMVHIKPNLFKVDRSYLMVVRHFLHFFFFLSVLLLNGKNRDVGQSLMSESVICTMKLEDWTRLEMKLLGNEANLALSWAPGLALMALKKKISFIGTFLKLGDCPWKSRFLVSSAKSKSEFPGKFWPLRLPSTSHVSCLQIGRHCSPSSFLFCSTWWRWFLEATFLRAVLSVWWPEENGVCVLRGGGFWL